MNELHQPVVNPAQPSGSSPLRPRLGFFGPLAALTAIVLGSALAIEFGLVATWVIFWVLRHESPEIQAELGHLPAYCLWFAGLSAVGTLAMTGLLKARWWRWRAQLVMWALVMMTVVWFVWLRR